MKISGKNYGFTLFEIIVSLGVFSIAVSVILSAMASITDAQRKAITLQSAEDNLRFALESMSREIRTGHDYDCNNTGTPNNCAAGGFSFSFISTQGSRIIYRWNGLNYSIEQSTDSGVTYYPITSSDIKIDMLRFYVLGTGNDQEQPRVLVAIRALAQDEKTKVESQFNIQTTVAQRELDY